MEARACGVPTPLPMLHAGGCSRNKLRINKFSICHSSTLSWVYIQRVKGILDFANDVVRIAKVVKWLSLRSYTYRLGSIHCIIFGRWQVDLEVTSTHLNIFAVLVHLLLGNLASVVGIRD